MKAMVIQNRSPIENRPLQLVELPNPVPGAGEVLVRVEVCGICRTDLHVIEGELPACSSTLVPGHQIVGHIAGLGPDATRFRQEDRVGIAWLNRSCGICPYCRKKQENLCDNPRFTGYHVNGGYAEYVVAPEAFIYPLPPALSSTECAPLLCAGIIGYRAYTRSEIKRGERLGLYGFGASAHVVIQIAQYYGCEVYVSTRGEKHRELASRLGATWVGDAQETPPQKLNGAIVFAPAGELVPFALSSLDKGGTLALAGIYMSQIPPLDYERHLFLEKKLCSVTANTREDGEALFQLAKEVPIKVHTELFPLEQANEALYQLKCDGIQGAGVLRVR
ncbi:MAG: zinc-dependent alcohol dehydrogenase family protein [Nitrospirae bacterium]|nr:zinc-dependent alcohol dehydrogenase family protein [Nitrospirota bacterium]MBI3593369.1 zinc-dependent alcohol dehydrogenase family protein [Nitrospirota bacterium]